MDIKAQSLYSELQSMANQIGGANPVQQPAQINPSQSNFAELLGNAIDKVNGMQLEAKGMVERFELGDPSLSLADVMVASEKSGIAFEATVQVRNKVLEAYRTIINMPV